MKISDLPVIWQCEVSLDKYADVVRLSDLPPLRPASEPPEDGDLVLCYWGPKDEDFYLGFYAEGKFYCKVRNVPFERQPTHYSDILHH